MPSDTERLDWLERQRQVLIAKDPPRHLQRPVYIQHESFMNGSDSFDDIRVAIDAAMQSSEPNEKPQDEAHDTP